MKLEEVIIELSFNCNLSCIMCGFGRKSNPFDQNKFLSFTEYKTIAEQVADKASVLRLNGRGESTIHPDFVDIVNYTKENYPRLNLNLFTNFSFNSHSILQAIRRSNLQLFVSLDSPENGSLQKIRKGANFEWIMNNLKLISDMNHRPFIVFTIQEANLHQIEEIGQFGLKNNCHILYNSLRRDDGIEVFYRLVKENATSIRKQLETVHQLYREVPLQCLSPDQIAGIPICVSNSVTTFGSKDSCPAIENELCILYDGTVTPCNMFNPYQYGNLANQSLEDIWEGSKRSEFLANHKNHYYCRNCANLGK